MTRSTISKTKQKPHNQSQHTITFDAIGTRWQILLDGSVDLPLLEKLITKRIGEFDVAYSRFRSDSLVTRMSKKAGTYTLPTDARPLFDLYWQLYQQTDGVVTPLIGQVLVDAGYDAAYSLQPKTLSAPPSWETAMTYTFPMLKLTQPVLLDVGAAGKGYLVDIIGNLLDDHGVHDFVINAGGDILHHTTDRGPIEVALEHPKDTTQAIGVATLSNQSICGSSGNRRAWQGMHHIVNPHTLRPVHDILAVWTVADTAMLADALSTCLFFVSPNQLKTTYTFEYALVRSDQSLEYSSGFPARFF